MKTVDEKRSQAAGKRTTFFLLRLLMGRHESYFHVFLGAGNQVPAATQVELVFNVLAMALDGFDTQVKRMRDLGVPKA